MDPLTKLLVKAWRKPESAPHTSESLLPASRHDGGSGNRTHTSGQRQGPRPQERHSWQALEVYRPSHPQRFERDGTLPQSYSSANSTRTLLGSCFPPSWPFLAAPCRSSLATSIRSHAIRRMARRYSSGRAFHSCSVHSTLRAARSGSASRLTTRRRCSCS